MELNDWSCTSFSCTRNVDTFTNSYNRINNDTLVSGSSSSSKIGTTNNVPGLRRSLWRKIMKEKIRKIFNCTSSSSSSSARVHYFAYDPYDYSQNFDDQGAMWSDPDTMSRSFSARFAVPCRVFEDGAMVA